MDTIRYHIEVNPQATDDRSILQVACALAQPIGGDVVSTTSRFNGSLDLAVVEIPAEQREWFEESLEETGYVISFR